MEWGSNEYGEEYSEPDEEKEEIKEDKDVDYEEEKFELPMSEEDIEIEEEHFELPMSEDEMEVEEKSYRLPMTEDEMEIDDDVKIDLPMSEKEIEVEEKSYRLPMSEAEMEIEEEQFELPMSECYLDAQKERFDITKVPQTLKEIDDQEEDVFDITKVPQTEEELEAQEREEFFDIIKVPRTEAELEAQEDFNFGRISQFYKELRSEEDYKNLVECIEGLIKDNKNYTARDVVQNLVNTSPKERESLGFPRDISLESFNLILKPERTEESRVIEQGIETSELYGIKNEGFKSESLECKLKSETNYTTLIQEQTELKGEINEQNDNEENYENRGVSTELTKESKFENLTREELEKRHQANLELIKFCEKKIQESNNEDNLLKREGYENQVKKLNLQNGLIEKQIEKLEENGSKPENKIIKVVQNKKISNSIEGDKVNEDINNIQNEKSFTYNIIRANQYIEVIIKFLKKEYEKNPWSFKDYCNFTKEENLKIEEIYSKILHNLEKETLIENNIRFKLHLNDIPLVKNIIKSVPLSMNIDSNNYTIQDTFKIVYAPKSQQDRPSPAFRNALKLFDERLSSQYSRTSSHINKIVRILKEEFKKESWNFDNYTIDEMDDQDKKHLEKIYSNLFNTLKQKYPNEFETQIRLNHNDQDFVKKIIVSTPLILDKKFDDKDSIAEIYRIVSNIKETNQSASIPFRKASKLFFESEEGKFSDLKLENKGEQTLQEKNFLTKNKVDIKSLESRWDWVEKRPELVPRFYRSIILAKFKKVPRVSDIKNEFGGGFRGAISRKLGMTMRDVQNLSGIGANFNKKEIQVFFSDKRTPEALLIKNLCLNLNLGISDLGKDLLSRGKSLKINIIEKELAFERGTYFGFNDETIQKIESFLKKLPEGAEINDDFHNFMKERKTKSLESFEEFLKKRQLYKEKYKTYKSTNYRSEFEWNKKNFKEIEKDIFKSKLETILIDNRNFKFPIGVFYKNNPRCSNFSISGSIKHPLYANELESYIERLKITGDIIENSPMGVILKNDVRKFEEKFIINKEDFSQNGTIKHEPLLDHMIKNNENAIAKEVFIWKPLRNQKKSYFLTGHIDLLLTDNNMLYISDYKPEDNNFMRSIPQVASYGLILGEMLDIDEKNIRCISFNKNEVWEYSPTILLKGVKNMVEDLQVDHPSLNPIWEQFF